MVEYQNKKIGLVVRCPWCGVDYDMDKGHICKKKPIGVDYEMYAMW